MSQADSLTPKQINRVLKTIDLMQSCEMKKAVIVLSHSCLRITEIALLETKSIIYPSGKIRSEIFLPAKICKNLKPRSAWINNAKTKKILQVWINYRIKKRWGTVINATEYQGLNPNSKFIFSKNMILCLVKCKE